MLSTRTSVLLIEESSGDARLIRGMLAEAQLDGFAVTHVERLADGIAWLERE